MFSRYLLLSRELFEDPGGNGDFKIRVWGDWKLEYEAVARCGGDAAAPEGGFSAGATAPEPRGLMAALAGPCSASGWQIPE